MPENTCTAPLAPMEPDEVADAFAYPGTAGRGHGHRWRGRQRHGPSCAGCPWTSPRASSSPSPPWTTAMGSRAREATLAR